MCEERKVEIWGGIEGTINRVENRYIDQSIYSGHYNREGDIDLIASLGIRMLRYPVLWEKHQPQEERHIDWSHVAKNLERLKELSVEPIAGLVHHGSGPLFVNFFDGSFEKGLAGYARQVAERFPWLEYYTPVNEPLTTARFCGLYGHWYPHHRDDLAFYKILLSECKATVMAMKAIREINPRAKLVQTEDLSKTYSTPLLQYQADLENHRRWLSYDLLCGKADKQHPLWDYLTKEIGLTAKELQYFTENPCMPDICGFNYYVTSERFLDEDISRYPERCHGGNGLHRYADVELVRVPHGGDSGPAVLLREAYDHVRLPIAVTECHLHCTRDEQLRWFHSMWQTVNNLHAEGLDIRALTAWSLLGAYGWDRLVTKPWGTYEPGVFDLRTGKPRPTALAWLIRELSQKQTCDHPVLETAGWWERETRILYPGREAASRKGRPRKPACRPLLVVEDSGSLSTSLDHICAERNIHHLLVRRQDLSTKSKDSVKKMIRKLNPWAVVHAGEYSSNSETACASNVMLAEVCWEEQVKLAVLFSNLSYWAQPDDCKEVDEVSPSLRDEQTGMHAHHEILEANKDALVIHTGNLFSPWDNINFITAALTSLKQGKKTMAAHDVYTSVTYVPDLVRETLDLLLDNESGIVYLTNEGKMTWADIVRNIAEMTGCNQALVDCKPGSHIHLRTASDFYSNFQSKKIQLPAWQHALRCYLATAGNQYRADAIAV